MYTKPKKTKPKTTKKKTTKPKTTKKKKTINDKLKEHAKHHTAKHMKMMKKDIKAGMSFTLAHNKAKKMVGNWFLSIYYNKKIKLNNISLIYNARNYC